MKTKIGALAALVVLVLTPVALAQPAEPPVPPLVNWTAPPYWTLPKAAVEGSPQDGMRASVEGMTANAESLPSTPVPFVAIAPCRIVDTRVPTPDGFHEPNFADGETRTFDLPSSPDCPGLPATSVAYSLNVQYRPLSVVAFITLFPTGTAMPAVSTLTASPAAWVENAAIIPAGTSGQIDVYCQYAGRVVIDVNGYYAAQSLVSSLNAKTGDLTLAAGSNVTITPSGNTLTIAATGGAGGVLPTGTAGETLRSNGSGWLASSALTNDGTNVGISGNLSLPNTTATTGQIKFGGNPFIHDYGTGSTFVGVLAGNFSMTGSYNTGIGTDSLLSIGIGSFNTGVGRAALFNDGSGSNNTGVGASALFANGSASQNTALGSGTLSNQTYDPGSAWASDNTAVGYRALTANQPTTTSNGIQNTAVGSQALQANTTGGDNTANGYASLYSNTTGGANTANGYTSLYSNTTGIQNTANGYTSLFSNTTGSSNTASGTSAGGNYATGSNNTFLGAFSDASADGLLNATAIGFDAIVDSSFHVRIGDTSVTQIGGQVAWSNLSDARAKSDIRDLDLGLDFVLALRPVAFTLKTGDGRTDMGFLAQDVEAVLGDGYSVLGIGADKDRTLSLRYTDLIAPMVKAVQEQQRSIEAKDARIAALENQQTAQQAQIERERSRNDALEARLAALEARLERR